MQMKAMSFNFGGDSVFYTRLLSYLKENGILLESLKHIRSHVFILKCHNAEPMILKRFDSAGDWENQKLLTSLLKERGFYKTYDIYDIPPFYYEYGVFGCIQYLEPASRPFHFSDSRDRSEGLSLLDEFHAISSQLPREFSVRIHRFRQIDKWQERLQAFRQNFQNVSRYVSDSILKSWLSWGEWALQGMRDHQYDLCAEENVIIHGDCAHHNFLRSKEGELFLIDFDLISSAPAMMDDLQYCNRILSYLENPAEELWTYPEINRYKNNTAFLYALTYPADVFREWNRLIRENQLGNGAQLHHIWKLTVEEYPKRMKMNAGISQKILESSGA
ncbi:Phosphotransferase enzyme family protein [Bacillus sp. OV322]|nr:Phosphotransferase enzyme family protein [Bacillus sp. OV322]